MHKEGVMIDLIEPLNLTPWRNSWAVGNLLCIIARSRLTVSRKRTESLKAKGIRMVSEKPFQPSEMARINFIHPSSMGGILIELIERS